MEPLDEKELDQLLRKWEAPGAPSTLEARVFPEKKSWWKWVITGSIRVPVPVAVVAAVVIMLWLHYSKPEPPPQVAQPGTVSLADFKPVRQLEPVLVKGGQK